MSGKYSLIKKCLLNVVGLSLLSLSNLSAGHLMVAQHGTLNFVDRYAYIVLSLPISAFEGIDDNKDGEITLNEFNNHRKQLSTEVIKSVYLSDENSEFVIDGLLLNPSFEHEHEHEHVTEELNEDQEPQHIEQVTITGRYSLPSAQSKVNFNIKLFSAYKTLQRYEITAMNKKKNNKYQFYLTPSQPFSTLFN